MAIKVSEEQFQLFAQLRRGGIPLDESVLEEINVAHRGLAIYQSGNCAENRVFELESGATGFMMAIAIDNTSKRVLRPRAARLEILWPEPNFRWLENPVSKVPREDSYSFPRYGPEGFDPEVVLNHRLDGRCGVYPDDPIEGLLLGVGQAPIPDRYLDRQSVRMKLTIFEGREGRSDVEVILGVCRERNRRRSQTEESLRNGREPFAKPVLSEAGRLRAVTF